jgi:hypothetical protein
MIEKTHTQVTVTKERKARRMGGDIAVERRVEGIRENGPIPHPPNTVIRAVFHIIHLPHPTAKRKVARGTESEESVNTIQKRKSGAIILLKRITALTAAVAFEVANERNGAPRRTEKRRRNEKRAAEVTKHNRTQKGKFLLLGEVFLMIACFANSFLRNLNPHRKTIACIYISYLTNISTDAASSLHT